MRDVLIDLNRPPRGPTIIYTDSKAVVELSIDAVAFKKTKHILRDAEFLRDVVARLVFTPKHVVSADMLADIMTKPLPRPLFIRLRGLLHLHDLQPRKPAEAQKAVEARASSASRRG